MNELDFSGKQVLVVGGSSGIGNGIAQAFRARGARVACLRHPRSAPPIIPPTKGSHLDGLDYAQLDVSDAAGDREIQAARSTGSTCWCWRRAR